MTDTDTLREALEKMIAIFPSGIVEQHGTERAKAAIASARQALATLSKPEPAAVDGNDTPPSLNAPTFNDRAEERVCINGCLFLRADFAARRYTSPVPSGGADLLKGHFKCAVDALRIYDPAIAAAIRNIPLPAPVSPLEAGKVACLLCELINENELLLKAAQTILDRGYVSEHIEEERADYLELKTAVEVASSRHASGNLMGVLPGSIPTAAAPDDGLMGRYRALVVAAQRVLDGGYVSEHIEEERADHEALKDALAALSTATGDEAQQGDG